MINARCDKIYSGIGFIKNIGMLSYPIHQSLRKRLMILRTSLEFDVFSLNCSIVFFSVSDVIVRLMSHVFTGL